MAEARAGWNDERGRAADTIPGLGLAEVVGARETDVQTVEKGKAALRAEEGLPGLKPGEVLPGRWYEESLEPIAPGARVVARFASGAPAAVVSAVRQGQGADARLVRERGLRQPAGGGGAPVLRRASRLGGRAPAGGASRATPSRCGCCESGREHLAFVFNHAATPATAAVTLRVPLDGRTVVDLASGEAVAVAAGRRRLRVAGHDPAARRPRAAHPLTGAQSSGFVFRLRNSIRQPSASRPKWPRGTPIGISLVKAPLTQSESVRPRATIS